jgi:hypothetical protein
LSSSSRESQLERPYEPQIDASFETYHDDLFLSDPLTGWPDWPIEIDPQIDLLTNQALPIASLTEGSSQQNQKNGFDSFFLDSGLDLGLHSTVQTQNHLLQPTSSSDIDMELDHLDQEEGAEEGNIGSNTPCAPNIPPGPDSSHLGFSQPCREVEKQAKALGNKRSQSQISNTSQTGNSLRGSQPPSGMQEQLQAKGEDTGHAIRLRRGRPSDRGVSCAYCALHKKKVPDQS